MTPGGWCAGARRAGTEPLWTGRARPYDESTLRQGLHALVDAGAVPVATRLLEQQVAGVVGERTVAAYTDIFDQVFWTKRPAHAAPIGSMGKRLLAAVYFGMTFVRPEGGPLLAYNVTWHKPASPLLDAFQALHADEARHAWLNEHVALHIADRGTKGDPVLRWCLRNGVPYLTVSCRRHKLWLQRYRHPTHKTWRYRRPIFVRPDKRLQGTERGPGRVVAPRTIVFPARPNQPEDGRAIEYRTAAELTRAQVEGLDETYKARWPNNENPIKALQAVGFGANLDRTLRVMPSRGHDGKVERSKAALAKTEERLVAAVAEGKKVKRLKEQRRTQERRLKKLQEEPQEKGARANEGRELLVKVLSLMLFNVLSVLLWKSRDAAVRQMTLPRVRELLLGKSALGCLAGGELALWIEPMLTPRDQAHQSELVRLVNAEQIIARGAKIRIRIRDSSINQLDLRVSG